MPSGHMYFLSTFITRTYGTYRKRTYWVPCVTPKVVHDDTSWGRKKCTYILRTKETSWGRKICTYSFRTKETSWGRKICTYRKRTYWVPCGTPKVVHNDTSWGRKKCTFILRTKETSWGQKISTYSLRTKETSWGQKISTYSLRTKETSWGRKICTYSFRTKETSWGRKICTYSLHIKRRPQDENFVRTTHVQNIHTLNVKVVHTSYVQKKRSEDENFLCNCAFFTDNDKKMTVYGFPFLRLLSYLNHFKLNFN